MKGEDLREFHGAINRVLDMPLHVDESSPLTIHDFEARTTRMVQGGKVKVVILDYIQLMDLKRSGDGDTYMDERQALTAISGRFVKLAKALQIPVVFLSQLSRAKRAREKNDRRPKASDMHGAGALEHNSHIILALYREEFDKPSQTELKNMAELIILKNRNGERGTIHLLFTGGPMRFEEVDPPEPPPEPAPKTKKKKGKEVPAEQQDMLVIPEAPLPPENT
jgi:replicative DNA helicase